MLNKRCANPRHRQESGRAANSSGRERCIGQCDAYMRLAMDARHVLDGSEVGDEIRVWRRPSA